MKRVLLAILSCVLLLCGCSKNKNEPEVAYVIDYSDSNESEFQTAVNELVKQSAEENGMGYVCYKLTSCTTQALEDTIQLARRSGVRLLFVTSEYLNAIEEVHTKYADMMFVVLDGIVEHIHEGTEEPDNIICLDYNKYDMGYFAGYLYAKMGYTKFACFTADDPDSIAYSVGMVYGYEDGAEDEQSGTLLLKDVSNVQSEDIGTIVGELYSRGMQSISSIGLTYVETIDEITNNTTGKYTMTTMSPLSDSCLFSVKENFALAINLALVHYQNQGEQQPVMFGLTSDGFDVEGVGDEYAAVEQMLEKMSEEDYQAIHRTLVTDWSKTVLEHLTVVTEQTTVIND
ncbi:MAG: BMP family ABC transporter substrate-binding protein [Erysipelotrichaceae bacterium]|nr:BMP family ABC transporter substrate-binding protein [Erysipelotrichaceae bacterium]